MLHALITVEGPRSRGGRFGAPLIRTVPRAEECERRYPCYMHAEYVHRLPLSPDDLPATSDSFSFSFGSLSPSRGYSQIDRCDEVLTLRGKQHVSSLLRVVTLEILGRGISKNNDSRSRDYISSINTSGDGKDWE